MRGLLAAFAVAFAALVPSLAAAPGLALRCPHGLLPLGRNAIGPAAAAALRAVPAEEDPLVVSASLAVNDRSRGVEAKHCGLTVWRRTVVVYITRRAYLPAQSASQGVYFVGRFSSGYRVWELVH
jgi:hypothetical protein